MLNGPLREPWGDRAHPFPVTLSLLAEAISRLRAVSAPLPQQNTQLWRGLKDRKLSEKFKLHGGTEVRPLQTRRAMALNATT